MPAFRSQALVLRAYNFGEADQVVVLFSAAWGKIRAVAKGVRRKGSRLAASLGWLTFSDLQLYGREHQDLLRVSQGQILEAYCRVKSDLAALGQAARCCELLEALTPDRQPLPAAFSLLQTALRRLESGEQSGLLGIWFEIRLLAQLGYKPELDHCPVCLEKVAAARYHPDTGGVACRTCRPVGGISVSPGAVRLLERLQTLEPAHLPRIQVSPQLRDQAQNLLNSALEHQLGRGLKSEVFRLAVLKLGAGVACEGKSN